MGILKSLFGKGKNTRNCDKCGRVLSSPDGYLLDTQKEEIEKRRHFTELAVKAGAAGVIVNLSPVAFVCETCLTNEATAQRLSLNPTLKVMSSARARHFWDTGEWEQPMFANDFPSESEESLLPWMNPALEAEWKKKAGTEPALDAYLATRASILGMCLM